MEVLFVHTPHRGYTPQLDERTLMDLVSVGFWWVWSQQTNRLILQQLPHVRILTVLTSPYGSCQPIREKQELSASWLLSDNLSASLPRFHIFNISVFNLCDVLRVKIFMILTLCR